MMERYVAPKVGLEGFTCPHCTIFADQLWIQKISGAVKENLTGNSFSRAVEGLSVGFCRRCQEDTIWLGDRMLHPPNLPAPQAHPELPETDDIKADYEEARRIAGDSPRGAAALLRLVIQKLCVHLGEKGKNINDDIASLVGMGLPVLVQRALDIVRVIGNESVHPGTMDLKDDAETAHELFRLVNFIVEDRIARPNQINALYQSLPESKRLEIEKRNAKVKAPATP